VDANTIEWLEPWSPVADTTVRRGLEQELLLEVADGHALFGQRVATVARRCDCDDVLFELEGLSNSRSSTFPMRPTPIVHRGRPRKYSKE
jgi:hypothetical protein